MSTQSITRFRGPHIGFVALTFVLLFLTGLFFVTALSAKPYFPSPDADIATMTAFFTQRQHGLLLMSFLHFGAAMALGIFTVSVVSQLQFLGVRAAGAGIALFGGLTTAINMLLGSSIGWALTYPRVAEDPSLLEALYRISFGLGGPGFSVPFGLLIAGISVTAGFYKLLPKWLVITGILIAVIGELSWFEILTFKAVALIPLTRFPGYLWIIAAGFNLPRKTALPDAG
jgi:hypothetical protein